MIFVQFTALLVSSRAAGMYLQINHVTGEFMLEMYLSPPVALLKSILPSCGARVSALNHWRMVLGIQKGP